MTSCRPERILYLEDMPDIAEITTMALEMFGGHEVLHCPDAETALDVAGPFSPDLLLLDVMMPGMSGTELLQALRRRPDTADIPAVFLTAKAQTHEQQDYLDLGAAGVITKPFDPDTLSDQLSSFWREARRRGNARRDDKG